MAKTKTRLLGLAAFLSFANSLYAADRASAVLSQNGGAPAFELNLLPESLAGIALPEVPAARQPAEMERTLQPGRSFTPKVEDQARVKAIMKLLSDIAGGVHLPYSQDGATFTNREGRLPKRPLGYYKEYTLLTGNAPHTVVIGGQTYKVAPDLGARGSERIVIGGGEFLYYTPDHYAHFIQLTVVQ